MLDLSEPPIPTGLPTLNALLHPPSTRLPSLRVLVLRDTVGLTTETTIDPDISGTSNDQRRSLVVPVPIDPSVLEGRRRLTEIIRGGGRQRYVEVLWD